PVAQKPDPTCSAVKIISGNRSRSAVTAGRGSKVCTAVGSAASISICTAPFEQMACPRTRPSSASTGRVLTTVRPVLTTTCAPAATAARTVAATRSVTGAPVFSRVPSTSNAISRGGPPSTSTFRFSRGPGCPAPDFPDRTEPAGRPAEGSAGFPQFGYGVRSPALRGQLSEPPPEDFPPEPL